jgi:hypothetical protein
MKIGFPIPSLSRFASASEVAFPYCASDSGTGHELQGYRMDPEELSPSRAIPRALPSDRQARFTGFASKIICFEMLFDRLIH